jgi:alkaline phosphatase D
MALRTFSRRDFARDAARWAGAALAAAGAPRRAVAAPVFINDPFPLGVASGDPLADGFVIWTRLAPDPLDPAALPQEAIPVTWEVAADPKMLKGVARGEVFARPEFAHSVHVDVRGLPPGRPFWYRFRCGGAASRVGRTHTLTTPRLPLATLRFAVASCQHYEQGYFTAYRDVIAHDPEFILHLGDYIYEISWGTRVRQAPVADAHSLNEYRALHAIYKTDPDLQAAHAACPWLVMWDDHEVANDYSLDESDRDRDPAAFHRRRRAAYQAYYEHMPLRAAAAPDGDGGMVIYQNVNFGDLVEIAITDQRQYRSAIACQPADWHAGRVAKVDECPNLNDPERTMLGRAQERWLGTSWAKSGARWNVLAQTLMLMGFDQNPGAGRGVFTDNWGGYPAGKKKVLDVVRRRKAEGATNFIALGGDIHAFVVGEVKDDDANPGSATLMTEFVVSSITSESYNTEIFNRLLPKNPQIAYMNDVPRGYMLCEVTPDAWRTTIRTVANVRVPEPVFGTLATFVVENGKTGARRA